MVLKTVDYSKSAIYANGAAYISGSLNINVPAIGYTSPNTGVHKNLLLSYTPTSDTMTYIMLNFSLVILGKLMLRASLCP